VPTIAGPQHAIDARGLTKRFGAVAAIESIDLTVGQGEVFGLIGADGAGKTTLLRVLCGVLRPDSGEASVAGQDVLRDPEGVKRRIGYLSQAFSLYADLTVEENIDFCADLYCTPRSEVQRLKEDMLAMTDLADFRRRLAGRLSGGMKQKLGLICALIHRPEVLILDEPTTGVDPISRRDFWQILADLPAQGVTVLLSSPYMDEASRCHRLALMHRGHILATGTTEQLQRAVRGTVLEIVTSEVRRATDALAGLPGMLSLTPFGDAIHARIEGDQRAVSSIESALGQAGVAWTEVSVVEASLEDAFLEAVAGAGHGP
jgi:ABC-2 type transport system ATP-binding protein